MIQYPTNVYPNDIAIDPDKITNGSTYVSFTFNGDILSNIIYRFYNYRTGEIEVVFFANETAYNGETVSTSYLKGGFVAGEDYVLQMMLVQKNASNDDLYDMPVLSGTVPKQNAAVGSNKKIIVESGITQIYEWGESDGVYSPVVVDGTTFGGMILEIQGERHLIKNYTSEIVTTGDTLSFGLIEVDEAFSFTIEEGMRYVIYSNYLISPQYYFKCRATPVITPKIDFDKDWIHCTAKYSQSENTMIKYYKLSLWASTKNYGYTKIAETEKQYSQNISFYFYDAYVGTELWDIDDETGKYIPQNINYKFICDVTTQDNVSVSAETIYTVEPDTRTDIDYETKILKFNFKPNNELNTIDISTGVSPYISKLFRTDLNTGKTEIVRPSRERSVSSHGNYKYTAIPYANNKPLTEYIRDTYINTDFDGYTITALYLHISKYSTNRFKCDRLKDQYIAGDTWKFVCDIDDTTVTQNTDKALHVGYNQYSSVSSTDVDYVSGTLSAMIGYMNCVEKEYTDTITLVNAWREFITQPVPFLLKSQKGDVWIINVTDNPTTEYQEDYFKVPTRFSFAWAECEKIKNIDIIEAE